MSRSVSSTVVFVAVLAIVQMAAACGGDKASRASARTVIEEVFTELDRAYTEVGRPAATFESMAQVQQRAQRALTERTASWPPGASFALSAMPDHVFVFVSVAGQQAEREWRP